MAPDSSDHSPQPDAAKLAQRGADKLAEFILTLAHDENGVGAYVRAFIAGDDPVLTTQLLESEIAHLRAGEREYDYRHRRGDVFLQRVDHVIDAIRLIIVPTDPRAAFGLLAQVIESDDRIAEQGGDAYLEPTFERACDLLLAAARSLPPAEVEPVLARLKATDDYGLRRRLF